MPPVDNREAAVVLSARLAAWTWRARSTCWGIRRLARAAADAATAGSSALSDGEVRGWSSWPFGQDWVRWTLLSWQRVRAALVATAPPRAMLRRAG